MAGKNLQAQYERWQPRAKYKTHLDPTLEDVKKLAISCRRTAKARPPSACRQLLAAHLPPGWYRTPLKHASRLRRHPEGRVCHILCSAPARGAQGERVLFHYNGHGVPRPTANGEVWVFNKSYTQYIPLSVFDLQVGRLQRGSVPRVVSVHAPPHRVVLFGRQSYPHAVCIVPGDLPPEDRVEHFGVGWCRKQRFLWRVDWMPSTLTSLSDAAMHVECAHGTPRTPAH
jgi:hypothetical protein